MKLYTLADLDQETLASLLLRPKQDFGAIFSTVGPIIEAVQEKGDAAIKELTKKFDRVELNDVVLKLPLPVEQQPVLSEPVQKAIDGAFHNIYTFHKAQLPSDLHVDTMPGITCSRICRPVDSVGLYVPGGSAVLPSTALMLGIPAMVAGCKNIVIATPPRADGTICPEVLYVAQKVGASCIVKAGGAQAVAAMALGTETVPKVNKICGPGNQYVTAAKMILQNSDKAMISIDMPAGPSEVLVVADNTSNAAFVAADLLSQAEHGPDSQVVLVAVGNVNISAIFNEIEKQVSVLPRGAIARKALEKSYAISVPTYEEALRFSNLYAPEHLILNFETADDYLQLVTSAGSVFVGPYSSESCGDYASGTNHTLPTYGYARIYSGVSTDTFLKRITVQKLTKQGLENIAPLVVPLAEVEGLDAHKRAVTIRLE
eukprot:TRINITY_DN91_c0_g2_i1.p1 TRINITY_DN91_c0_g2~~TRINITY_DN91_c0_g2_i1.p1  ORF type:complete len:430 (-),score=87.00 TRINITY_DN91_c0_g2_i1:157-1446(-)